MPPVIEQTKLPLLTGGIFYYHIAKLQLAHAAARNRFTASDGFGA